MAQCKVYNFNSYKEKRKVNEIAVQQDKDLSLFINSNIPSMDDENQKELSNHDEQSEEFYIKISEIMWKLLNRGIKKVKNLYNSSCEISLNILGE